MKNIITNSAKVGSKKAKKIFCVWFFRKMFYDGKEWTGERDQEDKNMRKREERKESIKTSQIAKFYSGWDEDKIE